MNETTNIIKSVIKESLSKGLTQIKESVKAQPNKILNLQDKDCDTIYAYLFDEDVSGNAFEKEFKALFVDEDDMLYAIVDDSDIEYNKENILDTIATFKSKEEDESVYCLEVGCTENLLFCQSICDLIEYYEEYLPAENDEDDETFVAVGWPNSQAFMEEDGFEENSILIDSEPLLDEYGSSAYLIRKSWLKNL